MQEPVEVLAAASAEVLAPALALEQRSGPEWAPSKVLALVYRLLRPLARAVPMTLCQSPRTLQRPEAGLHSDQVPGPSPR